MSSSTPSVPFESTVLITEAHLDSFGHVNNAVYMTLFEVARWDFITRNGFGLREIHERKKGPVVLGCTIQWKAELKNRESITIRSQCFPFEGKVFKLQQSIIKADGKEACTAIFTAGFFDLQTRKLITPSHEWLKACGLC